MTRKKDKRNMESMEWATWHLIPITVLGLLLLFLSYHYATTCEKFDPNKHDCDKIKENINHKKYADICLQENSLTMVCNISIGDYPELCKEWHDKSICSRDPNAEGCVCDERKIYRTNVTQKICTYQSVKYEPNVLPAEFLREVGCEINKTFELVESGTCISAHEPPKPIEINLDKEKCVEWTNSSSIFTGNYRLDWDGKKNVRKYYTCAEIYQDVQETDINFGIYAAIYNDDCCLRKEKLNECEKGEEGFILDWDFSGKSDVFYVNGSYYHCMDFPYEWNNQELYNKWCRSQKEFCRKKTIEDLNCEELKECIIGPITLCEYLFEGYIGFPFGVSRSYAIKTVELEFIERCGGKG